MSNDLVKKKYKILSTEEKKELQKRYESGENLLDLSIEMKISYGSLKNLASKKGWVKGKKAEILMLLEHVEESQELVNQRIQIKEEYKSHNKTLLDSISGVKKISMSGEIAFSNRAKALKDSFSLAKELYDIRTPKEEIELRTITLKYQELVTEIEKHKPTVIDLEDDIEEAEVVG